MAAEDSMWRAESEYRQSKGWFSCDQICTYNYEAYREREAEYVPDPPHVIVEYCCCPDAFVHLWCSVSSVAVI